MENNKNYDEEDVVQLYVALKAEKIDRENSDIYRQIEKTTGWGYATIVATLVRKDVVKSTNNGMSDLIDRGGEDTGYEFG